MEIALDGLAWLLVATTALPLLRIDQWWIRILDFPRGQLAILGILTFVLSLYFWEGYHTHNLIVLALLAWAVGYQIAKILPYTVLLRKQVLAAESTSDKNSLKLFVANVLMDNRESEAFLKLVHKYDPDIILAIEADEWWEESLRTLEKAYHHTLKQPANTTYGMLVYSRLEMSNPKIRFVLEDNVPSMHMEILLRSNDKIFMHCIHPAPPNPRYATKTTERDAEVLIIGREVEQRDKPAIIAGDFNDVAWSYTTKLFQKASGLIDPRVGRGMYNTFNAKNPLLRWPLDHVFHTGHFKLVRIERGPAWGSDHFPMFIELSLEPAAEAEQEEPGTSQPEVEEVDEKIEDGMQQSKV